MAVVVRSYVSPGAAEPNPLGASVKLRSYISPGAAQPAEVATSVAFFSFTQPDVGALLREAEMQGY